jgi:tRNA G18 (ribose-2'-O)-methylase SpoU
VYLASVAVVQSVVGYAFHRGCVAIAERGPAAAAAALIDRAGPRLIAVAEDLANPDNVGGVFRNALAFGADAVLLSRGCADPLYRKAIRVSAGASLQVPFATFDSGATVLAGLRAAGYCVIALTTGDDAVAIAQIGRASAIPERLALVVGSEDRGLREETRAAADLEVTIPMAGAVDSLNAATAVAIALHRLCRLGDGKRAGAGPPAALSEPRPS